MVGMVSLQNFKESLTDEEIIKIMDYFGSNHYKTKDGRDTIVFQTICHNHDISNASEKLFYYTDTKKFFCFTECNHSYDIIDIYRTRYLMDNPDKECPEPMAVSALCLIIGRDVEEIEAYTPSTYKSIFTNIKTREEIPLHEYDESVLNVFSIHICQEWLNEGMTLEACREYNIRYDGFRNAIIIPHYNIENKLIGIRQRNLNDFGAKYVPTFINNRFYNHRLSQNLYGINLFAKEKNKMAIIFEGEKSCIKYRSFFKKNNGVAICGSHISKNQIISLSKLGVKEIILALDKEFTSNEEEKQQFKKLHSLALEYRGISNMSFIFDTGNRLKLKDSPIDRGPDIFKELLKRRVKV